jgi:hypothetical protein
MMTSAFLSHSSVDKPFARRLTGDLRANGIDVWLDEEQIRPGQSIVGRINDGLAKNKFVLLAVSKSFLASEWATWVTNTSVTSAVNNKSASVIPLLIDDVWDSAPPLLADKLYIDFRKHGNIVDYRHSLGQLTGVLTGTSTTPKLNKPNPTVMVTGGRDPKYNAIAFEAAYEFGKLIGGHDYLAMSGTALGVDEHFARGVTESLNHRSKDPHSFLTCYYGRGRSAHHAFGTQLESAYAKREEGVPELITDADIVVLCGGSKNTQYAGVLAMLENKVVLPMAATAGAAKDVHNLIRGRFEKTFGSTVPKPQFMALANTNGSSADIAQRCFSLLQRFVS